ncbi:NADH dehydrogenase [ubiquinone] flavoprotein 3, mitochondrial [Xenentodon cancila]
MAVRLLRPLKCLQVDSWRVLMNRPTVCFSSQAKDPQKPTKKAKVADKKSPEAEEPFDNSTYKNCQHHSYTAYTFADLDVEMARYRLPQPSSGKMSPRH